MYVCMYVCMYVYVLHARKIAKLFFSVRSTQFPIKLNMLFKKIYINLLAPSVITMQYVLHIRKALSASEENHDMTIVVALVEYNVAQDYFDIVYYLGISFCEYYGCKRNSTTEVDSGELENEPGGSKIRYKVSI